MIGYLLISSTPTLAANKLLLASDAGEIVQVLKQQKKANTIPEKTLTLVLADLRDSIIFAHLSSDRIYKMMESDEPVCMPLRIKNPAREKNYLFSEPIAANLAQRMYQLASAPPIPTRYLNDNGELVAFADYINANPEQVVLKVSGHSYGAYLDNELKRINPRSVYTRQGNDPYEAYFVMLAKERVDFAILFPALLAEFDTSETPIRSYPFERLSEVITSHIMCNKHRQSRQFISRLNAAIRQHFDDGQLMEIFAQHYEDDTMRVIQRFFEQMYAQTGRSSNPG